MYQKKDLYLDNVIVFKNEEKNVIDVEEVNTLEEQLLEEGLYLTGPIVLHNVNIQNTEYEILLPVNQKVQLEDDSKQLFYDQLIYRNCAFSRKILEDNNISETSQNMMQELEVNQESYDEVFYAILKIPGGMVVDIYIPMQGADENE